MRDIKKYDNALKWLMAFSIMGTLLWGCATTLPPLEKAVPSLEKTSRVYLIGPGDSVQILVWEHEEFSLTLNVRPDGKITLPLVEDIMASGKTSSQLANDIEQALKAYIHDPIVTVIVSSFVGNYSEQVKVLGEAQQPQAIAYREGMTVLDLMIAVGGLTDFAAGNKATLIRKVDQAQIQYRVRLDDLIKGGDISANAKLYPGDILIIPEALF